MVQ
ncbi:hypothetical protein D047_2657A, partial [Vibrio parahaemolyticus VPTS-2010_2]|jgi:hypothetical protein